jgi:hypothetical protein
VRLDQLKRHGNVHRKGIVKGGASEDGDGTSTIVSGGLGSEIDGGSEIGR